MFTRETAQSSNSDGLMRGFWYPALRSNRVRGRELRTAMLLGIPLVIGRNSKGEGFALRDACPHRGMPLSEGTFDGSAVECPYHGWVFEGKTGQCQAIPSLTARDKLKLTEFMPPVSLATNRTATSGSLSPIPSIGMRKSLMPHAFPPSAKAIAWSTWRPNCPATWTTASSA